ncbi:MAG: hypothetical protein P8Y39_08165 [Nitrospirota bacterium]|jgi:hypothetical protein
MEMKISGEHPLRRTFREAARNAFRFHPELHTEDVETYFSEWLLLRFVHADNLQRIRTARGKRLHQIAQMLAEGALAREEGSRIREMAVYQHVGDYVLFMVGMFPEGLKRMVESPASMDALLVRVGSLYYPCSSTLDFCVLQGKAGYERASDAMTSVSPEKAGVLRSLARRFDGYVDVMSLVRVNLEGSAYFRNIKGIIGSN